MGGTKLRKIGIIVGILSILALFLVSANALPRIFPELNILNNDDGLMGGDGFSLSFELPEIPPMIGWLAKTHSGYITVTYAPYGLDWSDVDIGDSYCTLPSGPIMSGDSITNCQGVVSIRWIPSNSLLGTWDFSSSSGSTTPATPTPPANNDETPTDDTTQPTIPDDTSDNTSEQPIIPDLPVDNGWTGGYNTAHTVKISKPAPESLYFRSEKKFRLSTTIIIGDMDVETTFATTNESEISSVHFYIGDDLEHTDDVAPYTWNWDERVIGFYTISVIMYNQEEEIVAFDEINVFIINLQLGIFR
ncbi:MAG: hypothetical protein DRO67_05375 [Candidatus Asgardarchaeum californiense]|nr:MAG: hypothetical protein DRO67_05375 [Candidatus Asgardarchaeum californiense]